MKSSETVSSNLFQWFTENELKGNASKCHLLISSGENVHVNIGTPQIKNSSCKRLLGIAIYCKLSFKNHINHICTKATANIKSLARIAPFQNKVKSKLLMNAFFKSQLSYCLLSWMYFSRKLNTKINRLHERCLRIIYNDNTSSFQRYLYNIFGLSLNFRKKITHFPCMEEIYWSLLRDYIKLLMVY